MIIKFIKKKFNLIKICAVFTTVCFVVSTLGANLYAIPLAENTNQKYEDVFNKASSISAEYGKITSSRDGNSNITIINIQDLHCHPQTQRNISKIIAQIAEKYNLKEIYVEGGYGNIDLNWLTSIKDENIRKQVTEKLLEEGLLTGSEYYKLTSGNKDVELKGIDEEDLHRENVKRLAWIIENQGKYKDVIKKVENEINILEKIYVNSRNERFNRDIEKYLTSEIDTRRFYRQLIKYVKDINANSDKYNNITAIRLEDYPNIVKFITLRKMSKDIDVRKVTQQLQAVINELKNRLPYNIYTQLLKETENLSDSQKVVELVTSLCKKEGIDLQYKYKALNDFLQSNEINRELNTVKLVYEERQLITEIRKALSYNNEEYEITFVSDFSRFFKDYLEYKLTDADWKYFESGYEQFRQLYAKYATVDRIEEVEEDFAELNKYYGINDIRNEVFVNNLLQDKHPDVIEQSKFREDEEILKGSKEVIIAVTGGFHSNALEDILQAKEVNTIVITPSIFEGIEKATKQYKGIIKEQSKEFQHQALAYRILSSLKGQEQKIYLYGALKSLLGDNINKLKEVLGEDVDLDSLEKELQNLQLSSDEQSQLKVSRTTQFLESVVDAIINEPLFPKEGGKSVFVPNVNKIILKVSETLVDAGIFLSNGPIFAAEQRGLPYLKEIAPEIYSRMPAFIQEALVATEVFAIEESAVEEDTEEETLERLGAVIDDEESDSDYLSDERKAELLERLNSNEKTVVDTDLRRSAFENFIDYFYSEEDESEYIILFEKLFSLQPEILSFVNEKMDGQTIKDLLVYYEAEEIDKNLIYLLARYNKKLSSLKNFSRIVSLFENIEKLNYLSEQDFDYFMDLPNQFFIYVWEKTENSSQLKTKITVGKNFYPKNRFKNIDKDLAKAYFANAEKLESLDESYYERFIGLNKEAQLFILDNVKSSFDIERIFEFGDKNKISSNFDERVKDFADVRFKVLVKYISSVDDMSFYDKLFSTDSYGQKNIFGDYDKRSQKVLKIIVDSIDDANFIKEYLLNPKYKEIYKTLFSRLVELKIEDVAVENDYLALKLLTDENFNKALDDSKIHVGVPTYDILIARYHAAIAVSRFIYDGAESEIKDYDISEHKELIKEITDLYILLLRAADGNVLMDSKTKIYVLCNDEKNKDRLQTDRFNTASIERMAKLAGVEVPIITFLRKDNLDAKDGWLKQIEDLVLASDGKAYFFFNGHGQKNSLCVRNDEEYISAEELADRLFKLATKPNNPVDLRRVTIDLSCCHSYFFARDVYKLLEEKFKGNPDKESYPTIITAAGLETEVGYTRIGAGAVTLSNLHDGILTVLNKRTEPAPITLGMLALSEYQFSLSNITMFTSFSDETLLERIAETKKHISAAFKDSKGKAIEVESKTSDPRVKLKTKVPNLPIFGFEASIFKVDKIAPVWEELFYRAIPTIALTGLLLAVTFFFPAIPAVAVIAKLVCVGIFSFFQVRFVKAHIVTDWLEAMDAGGPVNLKAIFEDKSLTIREKINKTIEIIKERVLVIFPNSQSEKSFYRFYTRNKEAIAHREGLIIPTIVFSMPYLAAIIFFNSMPVIAIATIISMTLHFINNEVARTLEEKLKLKEKHLLSSEFLDIQKRLSHVELLIDNPQMKMDLPEIKVGRLALMFGLETLDERRAKNLSDYEKVRDSFINRLEPENLQKQKESIEKELSRIEGKKRKTKKDKEKIAELKEKLEIIEKEYPKIRAELLSTDTKKVEKIIDSINSLLPIFEEIEGILEEIEFFREVNGDTEETRELEREFLDFTEQTLMRELMSLYDANVTGLHVRRVVAFSKLIGSNMPFGNNVRMMYNLMLSSILHDIGKNLVPGTILNKQGSFDDLERDIMDFHVVFGGFILRSSILKNLSYTAENHHYTTKDSPRSYSFDSKMGYEHEAADYEEAQIAKIVTLTDVYEAVSPKLSFSTERTYQFPRKIRDISDMLENIDAEVDLTEFQKKEVIVLLAEIAQIDSEEDAAKKQEMEQAFIKKVLYNRSRSFVINYIREKNYDNVRANAFKIIFTKTPQEVFKELGKTEEEFMDDFEIDPEGTIDRCMSLVSEFEFDTAVVRAFLEFYFSSEDININDEIIESLNKEKESAFIVYMKSLSYSLYKIFRRVRFMMLRFTPVIASVFHGLSEQEEGVSIKEKFNIDTVVNYTVVIKRRNGDTHFLYFDERDFQEMGRKNSGVKKGLDSYGIQEIKYDEDGKIVDVILEPGATIDTDASGGEILVGSEAENLSFEDIEKQIKENYERKHHQKLEQEGFLLKPIMEDTGTTEKVDVYLDDDVKTILATIEDAINNNKLMVIHVFKEGFKTQNLSLWQRYQKYKLVYGLLDSRSKFESTFSKSSEIEEQFLKQIEDGLSKEEKEDMEWIKRNAAKMFFALREVLKNNFDHGNLGLFEYPIALHISKDNNGRVTEFSTYNLSTKPIALDRAEEQSLSDLMYEAYISGSHKGAEYMTDSFFTNLKYGDDIKISVGKEVYRIYRTKVTLKTEQEQEQALEKYNQYRQQKAEERRRYEQASEAEKKEIEEQEKKRNLAAFWEDFFSILKPFGVKLGNYAHVWEEALFRYLPTVFILLGYMNPLVGLGIQVVFILAHPLAKWMAARMNWEKAKKEGKQVGEKAGIGDLFKQIGKDFSLLTPTLVMMLPYVGALLSLAINPALSLIITPAIFTFTDVIVKWLTKKDSGGEVISIDKNLVIFITIVSLGSYIFLPLIPVIHPIVNALINPIVITNTINAGYLHYEYNKRQQDRSKSLDIGAGIVGASEGTEKKDEDTEETEEETEEQAKQKAEHLKVPIDLSEGDEYYELELDKDYEISLVGQDSSSSFRFKKDRYINEFSKEGDVVGEMHISAIDGVVTLMLPSGYTLVQGESVQRFRRSTLIALLKEGIIKSDDDGKLRDIFKVQESITREELEEGLKANGYEINEEVKRLLDKIFHEKISLLRSELPEKLLPITYVEETGTIDGTIFSLRDVIKEYKLKAGEMQEAYKETTISEKAFDVALISEIFTENSESMSKKDLEAVLVKKLGISEDLLVEIFREKDSLSRKEFLSIFKKIVLGISKEDLESELQKRGYEIDENIQKLLDIMFADNKLLDVEELKEGLAGQIDAVVIDEIFYNVERLQSKFPEKGKGLLKKIVNTSTETTISREALKSLLGKRDLRPARELVKNIFENISIERLEIILEQRGFNIDDVFAHLIFIDKPKDDEKSKYIVIKDREKKDHIFTISKDGYRELAIFLKGEETSLDDLGKLGIEIAEKGFVLRKDGVKGLSRILSLTLEDCSRPFTIEYNGQTNYLIFKDGKFYRISEKFGFLEVIDEKDVKKYGIDSYKPNEVGELSSIKFLPGTNLGVAVRQAVGISDKEMGIRMEQLRKNIGANMMVLDDFTRLPKQIITDFFEGKLPEDMKNIISINLDLLVDEDGFVSPDELKQVLLHPIIKNEKGEEIQEQGFFLEEDAEMWIERIFAKYIEDEYLKKLDETKKKKVESGEIIYVSPYQRDRILSRSTIPTFFVREFLKEKYQDLIFEFTKEEISLQELREILKEAGKTEEEIKESIKQVFEEMGYLRNIMLELKNNVFEMIVVNYFDKYPVLLLMLIEALNRGFSLKEDSNTKGKILTFVNLVNYLREKAKKGSKQREDNLANLRGYFSEIYLASITVAGKDDGITLRLQMPEASDEAGIDLIDPITGMKIQVKIDEEGRSTSDASSKNPRIPIFCTTDIADGKYKNNELVQGFIDFNTINGLIETFLYWIYIMEDIKIEVKTKSSGEEEQQNNCHLLVETIDGKKFDIDLGKKEDIMLTDITEILVVLKKLVETIAEEQAESTEVTGEDRGKVVSMPGQRLSEEESQAQAPTAETGEGTDHDRRVIHIKAEPSSVIAGSKAFSKKESLVHQDIPEETVKKQGGGKAILPENMGLVNRIMQSKFGNAFVAATVIAFKEFKASMRPSFVDMHQSESGRKGAQQLRDFITRFDVVETDGLAARIIKSILGTIVKGASIVKHIAIDYRYIKASGIQEAISMFGNNTYMDEYGQIHIPPVLIVNDLTGLKDLKNTGIKVNGRYIYQVGQKGILIYGAEGVNSEDISMAVNESQTIKDAIEQMIREKGYDGVSVEVEGVIQEEGEGVRFDKGITIIGTEELQNKSADYIDGYVSSSIELKRTVGIMYSQKALISLESIDDAEKLKQALYQGRARKIMSKSQYEQLNLTQEEIMALRKNGIEIYVDSNEINMDLKAMGIVGQIVRKNDGQILIHDYYAQEEIEVEEIGEEDTLINMEDKLVNSSKPVMIDIKVLAKTFQKENILTAYKGLNNLIGNLKLKTGIGELNKADIMSLIYNLDYNKLPLLSMLDESKSLQEYKENEIEEFLNTAISSMDTNTEIKIILKAIQKNKNFNEEDYNEFVQIIKERILAKTALTKNYKEFGLKDKKLEILLGEMLYKQLPFAIEDKDLSNYNNVDITYINERNERVDVQGENGLMEKIKQDTEKAMRNNDRVAINSIIDIILTYGDSYKDKQLARQLDANDARNYRAMMAAA